MRRRRFRGARAESTAGAELARDVVAMSGRGDGVTRVISTLCGGLDVSWTGYVGQVPVMQLTVSPRRLCIHSSWSH